MWRRLMLLGALALGLSVAPAGATIHDDPVTLKLVGTPPVARRGQPLRATFELSARSTTEISNLAVEGDGWTGRAIGGRGPRFAVTSAAPARVEFEATPSDPSGLLVVRYESGGRTYRRAFDFSPATDRLGREGRGTRALAGPPAATRPSSPLAERRAEPRGFDFDGPIGTVVPRLETQAPALPAAGRVVRVTGTFVYKRDYRIFATDPYYWLGADGLTVQVWDRDFAGTGHDLKLGEGVTDAFGRFDLSVYWDDLLETDPDLMIVFIAVNSEFIVTPDNYPVPYYWGNGPYWNFTGSLLDLGTITSANETDFAALHVLTDLVRDWRWYVTRHSLDLPPVSVFYPCTHRDISHYSPDEQSVSITEAATWEEDTHAHEYGHHFHYSSLDYVAPFYCNLPFVCDPDPPEDCGHCSWCPENASTAWTEGLPYFVAYVQTTSYEQDYGLAALSTGDYEDIKPCPRVEVPGYSDPFMDEAHAVAVMQDIYDAENDEDAQRLTNGRDALALGEAPVLDAIFAFQPKTLEQFIAAFRTLHFDLHEELWQTLANNRIDLDVAAPGAPGNLHSVSHTAGVESPDATPTFAWTRPDDDFSGALGYSVRIGATAAGPDSTRELGDVTTWTSAALAPGHYWVTLRAQDRAGHWSGSYATWGELIIREATPANLQPYDYPGWADALVPRPTGDATFLNVDAPTAPLPSGTAGTYWNAAGKNAGEASTGINWLMEACVDGAPAGSVAFSATNAGSVALALNKGPLTVAAGRHTLSMHLDADEEISETSETDNGYGRQWIWAPATVTSGVTRPAPPDRTGGWEDIPLTVTRRYDVDGLRVTNGTGSYWRALYIRPNDTSVDYDCRIHFPTASPDTGFATYLSYSARPAGCTDAVLYSRLNTPTVANWDVGVVNASGGAATYYARLLSATDIVAGDSIPMSFTTGEMMRLRQVQLAAADTGWYSARLSIVSGSGPVYLAWYGSGLHTATLLDATASDVAVGTRLPAHFDVHLGVNGIYGLAVYRDAKDGSDPFTAVLEFGRTPPDYEPHAATGWYKPFVPRPAADGSCAGVLMPDTLYGDAVSTYLNFGVWNDSPGDQSLSPYAHMHLDGVQAWGSHIAAPAPWATTCYNGVVARTVPGGRHTLTVEADAESEIEETDETNNAWGKQWVWGPSLLTTATPLTRAAPPAPTGGWDDIADAPYGIWYDCDGLRVSGWTPVHSSGYWGAYAVMPGDTSDVDVRLHEVTRGTLAGFRTSLVRSTWGPGQSDYCIVNFNRTACRAFDVGLLRAGDGTQSYTAQVVKSVFRATNPDGVFGPYTLAVGAILHLHEFWLDAGKWQVTLANTSGKVDWGLSVHDGGLAYHSKDSAMDGGLSWTGEAGGGESVLVTADSAGYYAVAVWKNTPYYLAVDGAYTLEIRPSLVDVPDAGGPAGTALGGAWPNPFRSGTRIVFDLAREADVSLEVYDLHGARVQTLASGRWSAGRHGVQWEAGAGGRAVAPGIYFVRLAADGTVASRRVVKLD